MSYICEYVRKPFEKSEKCMLTACPTAQSVRSLLQNITLFLGGGTKVSEEPCNCPFWCLPHLPDNTLYAIYYKIMEIYLKLSLKRTFVETLAAMAWSR